MCSRKKYLIYLILLLAISHAYSQSDTSEFSIVLFTGAGVSSYIKTPGIPEHIVTESTIYHSSFTARVMWFPNHRLRVGVESGYTGFYSYVIPDAKDNGELKLSSIPLLLVWSMEVGKNFNLFTGAGGYLVKTKLDYIGESSANTFSLGWMAAASYTVKLTEVFSLAPEIKWMISSESKDEVIAFQLTFLTNLIKW